MSVDPKCYDLACTFLAEVKGASPMAKQELAEAIQQTIEEFMLGFRLDQPDEPDDASPA